MSQGMTEQLSVGDRAINLTQVLKLAGWVGNGGEAKAAHRRRPHPRQ